MTLSFALSSLLAIDEIAMQLTEMPEFHAHRIASPLIDV
jgi:hypothetical protein